VIDVARRTQVATLDLVGFTVTKDGKAFVVTDNDGVEDASGETQLLRLGDWGSLFRHH